MRTAIVLATCACGSAPPVVPSPPPTTPAVTTAQPSRPAPPSAPHFAELDLDDASAYPQRASIRHLAAFYLAHNGPPAWTTARRWVALQVTVIDDDRGGSPRRPRVLCTTDAHRVAVYADAADLGTVTSTSAVLVEAGAAPASATDAPGVHLRPGTEVQVVHVGTGVARVRYDGLFLEAEGDLPADRLDVVYTPEGTVASPDPDAELILNVNVAARPDGTGVFAKIGKDPDAANVLTVRRLGAARGKLVLVRYDEQNAYAVGWVPRAALRVFEYRGGTGFGISGHGSGRGAHGQEVHLARGTRLAGPDGAIVGVVTADEDVRCEADCTDASLVRIEACGGELSLRAQADRNEK